MAPVLSDISIEWLYPETKEVLLSPVGTTYLFPGDRLIGYSVVCDTTRYHSNPKSVSKLQQGSAQAKLCECRKKTTLLCRVIHTHVIYTHTTALLNS